MNNFTLYKTLNFIVNKDVYAQAMTPDEFSNELVVKNMRLFRIRLGVPEAYRAGTFMQGVNSTRLNEIDLTPFLVEGEAFPVDTLGYCKPFAKNSEYVLSYFTDKSRSSEFLSMQELSDRLRNALKMPTELDMAAIIVPDGIRVYPNNIGKIYLNYYRTPIEPKFVTTMDSNNDIVYDSMLSIELEWNDGCKLDIMHMILQDFGLNIQRGEVLQVANKLIEQGK